MPKCQGCDEFYADQLRRCPYCGNMAGVDRKAVEDEFVSADEATPAVPLGYRARQQRKRRMRGGEGRPFRVRPAAPTLQH